MRYIIILGFCTTLYCACNLQNKVHIKQNINTVAFSIDSLDNINYFDFYGKSLEEFLENKVTSQYSGSNSTAFPGFFGYLRLYYIDSLKKQEQRDLDIYFSILQYTNEDTLNSDDYVPINKLMKEKIRHIQFADRYPIVKNQEEEQRLLYELENMDISKYYGKPLDSLLKFPPLSKWSSITFENEKLDAKNCLKSIWFHYVFNDAPNIILIVKIESFEHSDECIGILNRHWNLNDLRKETVKDIKLIF